MVGEWCHDPHADRGWGMRWEPVPVLQLYYKNCSAHLQVHPCCRGGLQVGAGSSVWRDHAGGWESGEYAAGIERRPTFPGRNHTANP